MNHTEDVKFPEIEPKTLNTLEGSQDSASAAARESTSFPALAAAHLSQVGCLQAYVVVEYAPRFGCVHSARACTRKPPVSRFVRLLNKQISIVLIMFLSFQSLGDGCGIRIVFLDTVFVFIHIIMIHFRFVISDAHLVFFLLIYTIVHVNLHMSELFRNTNHITPVLSSKMVARLCNIFQTEQVVCVCSGNFEQGDRSGYSVRHSARVGASKPMHNVRLDPRRSARFGSTHRLNLKHNVRFSLSEQPAFMSTINGERGNRRRTSQGFLQFVAAQTLRSQVTSSLQAFHLDTSPRRMRVAQ